METVKLKVKVTHEEVIEKEIQLPFYAKKGYDYFKLYSPQRAIKVYLNGDSASMSDYNLPSHSTNALKGDPSNEQEFSLAYTAAIDLLSKNADVWVSHSPFPTPEEYGLDPNGNQQKRDTTLSEII